MTRLNANRTQGKYMALNCVPNQNVTMVSLLSWHQTYIMDITIGSISIGMAMKSATMVDSSQLNINMKK